jgi:hypothetical protein
MKKNIITIPLLVLGLMIMIAACKKNAVVDITTPYSGGQFKYYNFAINAPTVNFYANSSKTAATASASGLEAAAGTLYGGVTPTRGYALAPVGTGVVFKAITSSTMPVVVATGQGPSIEIASVTQDVVEGKNYSFYTSGIYDYATKKSDAFIIEDNLPAPDTSISYIRLVNPGHNTSTLSLELTQTINVVGGTPIVTVTTPITGIAYKTASAYIPVKQGSYTLRLIDAASGKVVSRTATSFFKERLYTFTLRGNLITGSPAPFLDFTENR